MKRYFFMTTERVAFSCWQAEDLSLAQSLWGDPEVTQSICASGRFTPEEITARLNTELQNYTQFGVQYWPIFQKSTAELIGCCGLRPRSAGVYELGFHLRPKFWHQGYAAEAASAVIAFAFREMGAEKLFAGHNPKNAASRAVLNKLGFQCIGTEYYAPTGLNHPSYELRKDANTMETIYLAGGCLWGVQHFVRSLPGVIATEAGRANGSTDTLDGPYDGYAECVKTVFDPELVSVTQLVSHLFEIIDPYSVNRQGIDVGPKYRTGIYSRNPAHLEAARTFLAARPDRERIAVEVLPLTNYVRSADEHQDRLVHFPNDYCHIPLDVMNRYRNK